MVFPYGPYIKMQKNRSHNPILVIEASIFGKGWGAPFLGLHCVGGGALARP